MRIFLLKFLMTCGLLTLSISVAQAKNFSSVRSYGCDVQKQPWQCATQITQYYLRRVDERSQPKTGYLDSPVSSTITLYPQGDVAVKYVFDNQDWVEILGVRNSEFILYRGSENGLVNFNEKPCGAHQLVFALVMSALQPQIDLDVAFADKSAHWRNVGDNASAERKISGEYTEEKYHILLEKNSDTQFAFVIEKTDQRFQNPNILEVKPVSKQTCPLPKISDKEYVERLKNKQTVLECQLEWVELDVSEAAMREFSELLPIGIQSVGTFNIGSVKSLPDDYSLEGWQSNRGQVFEQLGEVRSLKPIKNNVCLKNIDDPHQSY